MESCATHMTHLDVEELLTLTVLAFFFSKTRSASFFFSNTPTQPHASLSQPQPSFFEQTHTGKRIRYTWIAPLSLSLSSNSSTPRLNFSSQTHRAQPHASLSSPPPLFSEKLRPARCCEAKSTEATCSNRRSHRTIGQPLPPYQSHRTAAATNLVMLHFPTS